MNITELERHLVGEDISVAHPPPDCSVCRIAGDEGILGAQDVIENELIKELDCYKEGKIVYFIRHANVWYTSTGGVQAPDTMLADLEEALLG